MEYLLLYVIAALGISILHRFICTDVDTSQDERMKQNFSLGKVGFEVVLVLIGAIWLPGTLFDIFTWHKGDEKP